MKYFKSLLSLMYMCVPLNRFVNPFTVQNDLLIAFSLCCSSARDIQVAYVVGIQSRIRSLSL